MIPYALRAIPYTLSRYYDVSLHKPSLVEEGEPLAVDEVYSTTELRRALLARSVRQSAFVSAI